MKRGILLLLTLLLLLPAASLADMDNDLLESTEGMLVYLDNDQINTIIRPEDQPFEGEVDMPYAYVRAYVDFVERPNDHATLMRLLVGLESEEPQYASELRVTVGGTTYCFPVETVISEYDMIYFEDYSVYFTDESLPMLKAIARAKSDTYDVTLLGAAHDPDAPRQGDRGALRPVCGRRRHRTGADLSAGDLPGHDPEVTFPSPARI